MDHFEKSKNSFFTRFWSFFLIFGILGASPILLSPAAALPSKPAILKKKCRFELFQKLFRQNRCTKRHFSEFETPRSKTQNFPKKSHFWGPNSVFPPFLAHFACKPHVGQKLPKMAFFEPKNRGIQKNISTIAHICWQTPLGTNRRQKTPILVKF